MIQDHEMRLELYNMGLSDKEIAEKVFLTQSAISGWRRKNGLKTNNPRPVITQKIEEKMLFLYKSGLSDREIGNCVSLSKPTVQRWRQKNELKPNFEPGYPKRRV